MCCGEASDREVKKADDRHRMIVEFNSTSLRLGLRNLEFASLPKGRVTAIRNVKVVALRYGGDWVTRGEKKKT